MFVIHKAYDLKFGHIISIVNTEGKKINFDFVGSKVV